VWGDPGEKTSGRGPRRMLGTSLWTGKADKQAEERIPIAQGGEEKRSGEGYQVF